MIALLCPTRGRPEQFRRMVQSAKSTSKNVIIFGGEQSFSSDDPIIEQPISSQSYKLSDSHTVFPKDYSTIAMWNGLANHAMKFNGQNEHYPKIDLFMLCADDVIFSTPLWDEALIDHYNKLENKIHVYALQDSRDPEGTPHPIVTREYIDAMGYFLPPIFFHWFGDSWTVEIAKANGCFTHLKDYLLIHDKPSDKGQADETHNHIRRMGWHTRDKAVAETCSHFLEWEKDRLQLKIWQLGRTA